jgi:hypothetical protein
MFLLVYSIVYSISFFGVMAGREDNPALGLLFSYRDIGSGRCSQSRMPDMDFINVMIFGI